MTTTTLDTTSYASSTENRFQMFSIMLCGIPMRMIVTNPENIMHCRSTWYCIKDLGDGVGATNSRHFLDLLRNKEEDSRIFSQSEVNSENDPSNKSTETVLLAPCKGFQSLATEENSRIPLRGLLFSSLKGTLEILTRMEIKHPLVDAFQDEIYMNVLPSLALTGKAELSQEYREVLADGDAIGCLTNAMSLMAQVCRKKIRQMAGKIGGRAKDQKVQRARADAAEAKTEEQAKTIDELKERLRDELEDWKTARDFCEPTRFSFYDDKLKWRISDDLVRVSDILHITWRRGEYSRQFRKQAFDVLLHHFCCDPAYLKEWRYDWHENMYKYGALSRECGDKLEGTPDILEGLV